MAAPAPMTMEPSIDDSDMSGNFKLNGAGSNKVLYYAPFHKNWGKTCGVIPSAYWVRLLPRSRTRRAVGSSSPESRVSSARAIRRRPARGGAIARKFKQSQFYTAFDSSGIATIAVSRSRRSPPARACPPPRSRDRSAGCPRRDVPASDSISSSLFARRCASAPAPSTRLWMTFTSATSPSTTPPALARPSWATCASRISSS